MSPSIPDRIQDLLDERVTTYAQAAQRHFKTNDLVVVLDFRDEPVELQAVAREDLAAAEELSLDLRLKLSKPASELSEVHGAPAQSFWFIVIFDDDRCRVRGCERVDAGVLTSKGERDNPA
ncbi:MULTISPECIES: hypothetical protein [unclassified Roseateles]|uniref:hypothetical protein n=1 Tax=unclassified Roseateles TaxID=2626991 RepID=UPI0012E3903F|nr:MULTISPECIES: hypothetical protein [unclassified Roseateles]